MTVPEVIEAVRFKFDEELEDERVTQAVLSRIEEAWPLILAALETNQRFLRGDSRPDSGVLFLRAKRQTSEALAAMLKVTG